MKQDTRITIEDISFGFGAQLIFDHFSLNLGEENPVVILGPSGCGKTTLLRLGAGLLKPSTGAIRCEDSRTGDPAFVSKHHCSFVFQEPRLLPWLTVWENVLLPIKTLMPVKQAEKRVQHFLELVSLSDKAEMYPDELSGGQRQRVSIARAFTYPGQFMFMDEPFQSLDIPLRIELMEMTLHLFKAEPRLLIVVTHDPREAIFLGQRVIVLGNAPQGVIFDEKIRIDPQDRAYASAANSQLEARLLQALKDLQN
jgi:NitT/TauT family transport system ATP-binding protein